MAKHDSTRLPANILTRYLAITHWAGRSPSILPFKCIGAPELRGERRARAALAVLQEVLADDPHALEPLSALQGSVTRHSSAGRASLAWLARISSEVSHK